MDILKQFVSDEEKTFRVRIGKLLASGLSGFIAGAVFASIFWITVIVLFKYFPVIREAYAFL